MTMNALQQWQRLDHCPICGHGNSTGGDKNGWCTNSADGTVINCRRDTGQGQAKVDSDGVPYWVHRLVPIRPYGASQPAATAERAEPKTLDAVYRCLLSRLMLLEQHRKALTDRGLGPEDIRAGLYRSLPTSGRLRQEIAADIVSSYGGTVCARVPGLFRRGENWSLAGPAAGGLLVPVLDVEGQVVALKNRADAGPSKYTYFSSAAHGGPGSGAPCHVPPFDVSSCNSTLRLTEGELKAHVATCLSRIPTVSAPGVSHWKKAIGTLKRLGAQRVLLAFDADRHTNEIVREAFEGALRGLSAEGFEVAVESWPAEHKGIDDLLAAGLTPTVEEARREVVVELAQRRPPADASAELAHARQVMDRVVADVRDQGRQAAYQLLEEAGAAEHMLTLKRHSLADFARIKAELGALRVQLRPLNAAVKHLEEKRREEPRPLFPQAGHDRPVIEIHTGRGSLTEIADAAEEAILREASIRVYQYCGEITTIRRFGAEASDEKSKDGIRRARGEPQIMKVSASLLREWMDRSASWGAFVRNRDGRDEWKLRWPPMEAVNTLLGREHWRFPELRYITETPTLRADGSILNDPGYDAASGILFEPSGEDWPRVPTHPTIEQARTALQFLLTPFVDFPFVEEHHRLAAVSAVLTLLLRPAIDGPTPMTLVNGNVPGAGKGLLVNAVNWICSGRDIATMPQATDESEQRKRITSLVIEGARAALIDNIRGPFGDAALEAALTSTSWRDRELGRSTTVAAELLVVFFGTGNNVELTGDMPRRILPIDLKSELEDPEERSGFTIPNLRRYVMDNRVALVIAALTIARAHVVAGRPRPSELTPIGSFEAWDAAVRAPLAWLTGIDPAAGRMLVKRQSNDKLNAIRDVLTTWREACRDEALSLSELKKRMVNVAESSSNALAKLRDALVEIAPDRAGTDWDCKQAGYAFRRSLHRTLAGLRLTQATSSERRSNSGVRWQVEVVAAAHDRDDGDDA